jgi:TonB family protein
MFGAFSIVPVLLLINGTLWAASPASLPQKVRELVDRSRQISDIRAVGAMPFRATGRMKLFDLSAPVEGQFELLWISPTSWKEILHFPGYDAVRIVAGKKYWLKRSLPYEPLPMMRARSTLSIGNLDLFDDERVFRISQSKENGALLECMELRSDKFSARRLCFDPSTGVLARATVGTHMDEYLEYQPFEGKRFPRKIRYYEDGELKVETAIENLTAVSDADSDRALEPALGSEEWDRCEHMTEAKPLRISKPDREGLAYKYLPVGGEATVAISAVIEKDGRFSNLYVIQTGGKDLDAATVAAIKDWKFEPAKCGDSAVRTTRTIYFHYYRPKPTSDCFGIGNCPPPLPDPPRRRSPGAEIIWDR